MRNDQKPQPQLLWEREFKRRLPLFGHRNWIVIADAAYPAHSRPGVETLVSGAGHLDVLQLVLHGIAASQHVRPLFYTDLQLKFVAEEDAPGISQYRKQLGKILNGAQVRRLPHSQIIAMLDDAALMFQVLVIKTRLLLPYTSVFVELDCGYWRAEAEQRLRKAMLLRPHSSPHTRPSPSPSLRSPAKARARS